MTFVLNSDNYNKSILKCKLGEYTIEQLIISDDIQLESFRRGYIDELRDILIIKGNVYSEMIRIDTIFGNIYTRGGRKWPDRYVGAHLDNHVL